MLKLQFYSFVVHWSRILFSWFISTEYHVSTSNSTWGDVRSWIIVSLFIVSASLINYHQAEFYSHVLTNFKAIRYCNTLSEFKEASYFKSLFCSKILSHSDVTLQNSFWKHVTSLRLTQIVIYFCIILSNLLP